MRGLSSHGLYRLSPNLALTQVSMKSLAFGPRWGENEGKNDDEVPEEGKAQEEANKESTEENKEEKPTQAEETAKDKEEEAKDKEDKPPTEDIQETANKAPLNPRGA